MLFFEELKDKLDPKMRGEINNIQRKAHLTEIPKNGGHQPEDYFYNLKNTLQPDGHVTFLDRFQSRKDFQNDLKGIFIKPLSYNYLSDLHGLKLGYQLGLAFVHLITGSPHEALDHFIKALSSLKKMVVYDLAATLLFVSETLSFVSRSLITLATGFNDALTATAQGISDVFSALVTYCSSATEIAENIAEQVDEQVARPVANEDEVQENELPNAPAYA